MIMLGGGSPLTIPPNSTPQRHLLLTVCSSCQPYFECTGILIGIHLHPSGSPCFLDTPQMSAFCLGSCLCSSKHPFLILCQWERVSFLKAGFCSAHTLTTLTIGYFHLLILSPSSLALGSDLQSLMFHWSNFPSLDNGTVELDDL